MSRQTGAELLSRLKELKKGIDRIDSYDCGPGQAVVGLQELSGLLVEIFEFIMEEMVE